jgi:outer membrane biogenesis lipoprotein LolB
VWRRAAALALAAATAACTQGPLQLPSGASTPLSDTNFILQDALGHCAGIHSLTAEIGLSGKVGETKLRGHLQAGFARPSSVRLEAVAPFGAPFFVLAGTGDRATLWLPRDGRVLRDTAAAEIVEALAGFAATPDDLAAWIAGCPAPKFEGRDGRAFGERWTQIVSGSRTAWFHQTDRWRLAAVEQDGLTVEFSNYAGDRPRRVRIHRAASADRGALDVGLAISQVETNVALGQEAFAVDVKGDSTPMTLDELRQSGPLRDRTGGTD